MIGRIVHLAKYYVRYLRLRKLSAAAYKKGPYRKVLVLGYAAIGDFIFLLPALEALRAGLPKARIAFVCNRYPTTTDFLPASGLVDDIWEFDAKAGKDARAAFHEQLRRAGFDAVLLSYGTPISAFSEALLGIPVRIGHCYPVGYRRKVAAGEHERRLVLNRPIAGTLGENAIERNLQLVRELGIAAPLLTDRRPRIPHPEEARSAALRCAPEGTKTIGVHLGSPNTQYGKLWAPQRWGEVCLRLRQAYGVRVAVIGGGEDRKNFQAFKEIFVGDCVDLVGKGGLLDSLAVLRRCAVFLAGDTGLAKCAIALGVPTVTVWGPTDPQELQPPWDADKHLNISHAVPCAPCVQLGMPKDGVENYTRCGHRRCLAELSPEAVMEAVRGKYDSLLRS
ncbi:MAG: glycosyltransferase family 9 protein [Elusimicrobiota bacterium]